MFKTEFFVCGVAPYGEQIVVLTYDEEGASTEVCIFEWNFPLKLILAYLLMHNYMYVTWMDILSLNEVWVQKTMNVS